MTAPDYEYLIFLGDSGMTRELEYDMRSMDFGDGWYASVRVGHPEGTMKFTLNYTAGRDGIFGGRWDHGVFVNFQPRTYGYDFLTPDGVVDPPPVVTPGVPQARTVTVLGDVTQGGYVNALVKAAGMAGSPRTVSALVAAGTRQQIKATVIGNIITGGNVAVVVTAPGMTGNPKTLAVPVSPGVTQQETATVIANVFGGAAQQETATVNGSIDTTGNAGIRVTAAGLAGSPLLLSVPVLVGDADSVVATKYKAALDANAAIAAMFVVTRTAGAITLTRLVKAANDPTMNIETGNGSIFGIAGSCAGLTSEPASANTRAGSIDGGKAGIEVTAAGLPGGKVQLEVPVEIGDGSTTVATKMKTALDASAAISAMFTVTRTVNALLFEKLVAEANDTSLRIAIGDGSIFGISPSSEGVGRSLLSSNTRAGAAPDDAAAVAAKIRDVVAADAPTFAWFNTITAVGPDITFIRTSADANIPGINVSIANGTCTGLTASPTSTTTVPGAEGDDPPTVAAALRAALAADPVVSAFFAISGSGATIIATALIGTTNDPTMNIRISNGTCLGLTTVNSTSLTAGSGPTGGPGTAPNPVSVYQYLIEFYRRHMAAGNKPFFFEDVDAKVTGVGAAMDYSKRSKYLVRFTQNSLKFSQSTDNPLDYSVGFEFKQVRGWPDPGT